MPRSEIAGEIEWAKNRMVDPAGYLDELERDRPRAADPRRIMEPIFQGYERRKERAERIDFEDMLGYAVRMYTELRNRRPVPCATGSMRSRSTSTRT